MRTPGGRVGAIESATEEEVRFYGFGVYVGDEVPPPGVGLWGVDYHELQHTNPRIDLDDGGTVWGCQCWWGSEERVRREIGDRRVVMVPPPGEGR